MDANEAGWCGLLEHARGMEPDPALAGLDDAQLEQEVRDGAARVAAATCRYLVHVAELVVRGVWADQHARTPAEWLSWACGVSATTAREHVRVGLALREAPLIRARLAAGTLSYSKVRAITRVVAPEVEEELVALADSAPAAQLDRIIGACRRQLDEQARWARGPDDGPVEVRDFRRVEVDPDTVELRIRLPRDDAAAFEERVDRLVDLADRAGADGPDAHAHVAIGVRRAVAVADGLATAVAAGPPDRSGADGHLVVLHADVADLAAAAANTTQVEGPTGVAGPGGDAPA